MNSRVKFGIASVSAVAATVSDFLMLFVANALRPDLHLPPPPPFTLLAGGVLGMVVLPFYALGYSAIADTIRSSSQVRAKVVFTCGIGIATLGAIIHGLTALSIHDAATSGLPLGSLTETFAVSGWGLLTAWIAASFLTLAASVTIMSAGISRPRGLPLWLSLANPVTATICISAISLSWEASRSFLLPAAPNMAHVLFFLFSLYALRRN